MATAAGPQKVVHDSPSHPVDSKQFRINNKTHHEQLLLFDRKMAKNGFLKWKNI
jgi:hypothetical protein